MFPYGSDPETPANWIAFCYSVQGLLALAQRLDWSAIVPVKLLDEHLSLLFGRNVPTKVIRIRSEDESWLRMTAVLMQACILAQAIRPSSVDV